MGRSVDLMVERWECFCLGQFVFFVECGVESLNESW